MTPSSTDHPDPRLPPGAVRVWLVDLDADGALGSVGPDGWPSELSVPERERAARFRSAEDARRWAAARRALRSILAHHLGDDPAALRFAGGRQDKPTLAGGAGGDLGFNLSHAGAVALVAVAADRPVGVDVEQVRPGLDVLSLARRVLDPAVVARLAATPEDDRTGPFFRAWVRHEAVTKCRGHGLLDPDGATGPDPEWVGELAVPDGYAAALAVGPGPPGVPATVGPVTPWP